MSKIGKIFDNFRIWSQISPEQISVTKTWKALDQLHFIPYWMKKLVNFGALTKKL